MTNVRGHILPFFIPHLGCPQQCIFCDQRTISGAAGQPERQEIWRAMEANRKNSPELAFYGGSFTAMPKEKQLYYLETAKLGLERGWISGVRVSTRPDFINEEILSRLRLYGVRTVELGVQSMNDAALAKSKRGHRAADSVRAVKLLLEQGFLVGVQLMPGLPKDDRESILGGAAMILALRPQMLRIYPTVVVAGTELAEMYERGEYQPLRLEQAVELSAVITLLAEKYDVAVIRTGLNTDEHLAEEVLAGPYHPAFGSLVKGYIWRHKVLRALSEFMASAPESERVTVYAERNKLPLVFGQNAVNRQFFAQAARGKKLRIKSFDERIGGGENDIVITDGKERLTVCRHEDFRAEFLQNTM